MRSMLLVAVGLAAAACAPNTSVQVLHPADVTVPGHIQKVAVIDRSSPDNVGGNVLGAIEGVLTGEGIMADREGRVSAVNQLAWTLREGDRYEVLVPNVTPQSVDSGVFDRQMTWQKAKQLCKKHDCDAIIALEAFDSDTDVLNLNDGAPLRHLEDGSAIYGARRETRVMASWRLYDTTSKSVIDEQRDRSYGRNWDNEGSSVSAARRGLPLFDDTVKTLGTQAGSAYGNRISPSWRWESRSWFSKGSPDLKQAKRYVRAGDWEGAAGIWRRMLESDNPKEIGKAKFNLALYNERKGNLRKALKLARAAAVAVPKSRTRSYIYVLERRVRDQERLEQQMAEAEEGRKAAEAEEARKAAEPKPTSRPTTKPRPSPSTSGGRPPVSKGR
ncbi:MAG: hypothetical protein KC912_04690 [Proteobacteria bacterium]|nr:hypothetical protein [Pseudomonadota bacterium]